MVDFAPEETKCPSSTAYKYILSSCSGGGEIWGPKTANKTSFLPRIFPFLPFVSSHSLSLRRPGHHCHNRQIFSHHLHHKKPTQPPSSHSNRRSSPPADFLLLLSSCHHQPPPLAPRCPPPPLEPPQVSLPPPFFFFFFIFFVPAVHCVNNRHELIHAHCSCSSGIWPRFVVLGRVRPSHKYFQKNIFGKICYFSTYFVMEFCVILVCIFIL